MKDMVWKDYPGNRLITDHPAGFKIIKPKEPQKGGQPLFCPVCDAIFSSHYDDESWKKFECCDDCANKWAYPNIEKWKLGWRPDEKP